MFYLLFYFSIIPLSLTAAVYPNTTYSTNPRDITQRDRRILRDIEEKYRQKNYPYSEDMQITVDNGRVTLNGLVDSEKDKRDAEKIASAALGVRQIDNHLRVRNKASSAWRKNLEFMQQGQIKQ